MLTGPTASHLNRLAKKFNTKDKQNWIIFSISFLLFLYTCWMAFGSDITYDEAFTYMNYAKAYNPNFLAIDLANNHPLNSFLVYISSFLFPYNEFAIRFPNILALLFYLIILIGVANKFPKMKLGVFGMLSMYFFLTPLFFSQARGYGIATMLVLWFISNVISKENTFKQIIRNFYILTAAAFAFPGILPLTIAVAIFYLFLIIQKRIISFIQSTYIDLVIITLLNSYILYTLMIVSGKGKPLFGSELPFFESTLGFYIKSYSSLIPSLENFVITTIALIYIVLAVFIIYKNTAQSKITIITLLTFLVFYLSSTFTDRPFVTGRLLLPFFPLVALSLVEVFKELKRQFLKKNAPLKVINYSLLGLFVINFCFTSEGRIKNNPYYYKSIIFNEVNLSINHNGCCSSIPFYKEKFFKYPPLKNILSLAPTISYSLHEQYEVSYFQEKNFLLLKASSNASLDDHFIFQISPNDRCQLPQERVQYGFDNLDFTWNYYSKEYMILKLPEYKFHKIKLGQYNTDSVIWSKSIDVSEDYFQFHNFSKDHKADIQKEKNGIEYAIYNNEKVITFIANENADLNPRVLFQIIPINRDDLPELRKQYGFDNFDFSWENNKRYQKIQLPEYEIKTIKIGQYTKEGVIWSELISI